MSFADKRWKDFVSDSSTCESFTASSPSSSFMHDFKSLKRCLCVYIQKDIFVQLKNKIQLIGSCFLLLCVVILIFIMQIYIIIIQRANERDTKKAILMICDSLTLGSENLNSSFVGSLISCCLWISRISALAELPIVAADDETFHSKGFSFALALRLELFICFMKLHWT